VRLALFVATFVALWSVILFAGIAAPGA